MTHRECGLNVAQDCCDICWLGDDFATQQSMMLSPEQWRTFIRPYLTEQVELAHEYGMYVLYHSCGAVRAVLEALIDIGIHGLLVFQTTAAGMDAESITGEFGGKMVFYGGIDVQHRCHYSPQNIQAVCEIARQISLP